MIGLITGGPGAGKSNLCLSDLVKDIEAGRPLFVHGIRDLKIPHEIIKCESKGCEYCRELDNDENCTYISAAEMHNQLPDDCLVVLDEVQHIYRPRKPGSAVPENVQFLETHRHRGIDFYFITQSPKLIDINCREMVTRHRHIVAGLFNRTIYEWPECNTTTQEGRTNAVTSIHTLDKKVYDLYKSAEVHTKQKRKVPFIIYPAAVALVFVIFAGTSLFGKIKEGDFLTGGSRMAEASGNPVQPSTEEVTPQQPSAEGLANPAPANGNISELSPVDLLKPRNPYQLESAPAFDSLLTVNEAPRMAACVMTADRCKCYTQQATEYPTTYFQCVDFIQGKTFNPYRSSP
ncbi:MAG: hypothetical protein CMP91_13190 [Gammaproteobacteria bacterium]|nr:hypothetical protein [Gammaproteobacteria bacterium]|tara:strand:- start:8506 stop:9546 length:1041 start_codon:yes stop_codon:yes gene_type:complete